MTRHQKRLINNFMLAVFSWAAIGAAATALGVLGILHLIFHDAFPGVLLVLGGATALGTAIAAIVRGRPSSWR
jgi:uncharacterized membrane protein